MPEIQSHHYHYFARGIVTQTSNALVAFLVVIAIYVFTYIEFIPGSIMLGWILSVFIFLALRFWNSKSLAQATTRKIYKKHVFYLLLICIYSAIVWITSSVLSLLYAPPNYEFFSLIMVILIAKTPYRDGTTHVIFEPLDFTVPAHPCAHGISTSMGSVNLTSSLYHTTDENM